MSSPIFFFVPGLPKTKGSTKSFFIKKTKVYRSQKGYQLIKIKRCADCDAVAHRQQKAAI